MQILLTQPLHKVGGGSGVQSDYTENDSQVGSYIKNRPFYEDIEEIPDTTIDGNLERTSGTLNESMTVFFYSGKLNLTLGEAYTGSATIPSMSMTLPFETVAINTSDADGISDYWTNGVGIMLEDIMVYIADGVVDISGTLGDGYAVVVPTDLGESIINELSIFLEGVPQQSTVVHKLNNKFLDIDRISNDLTDMNTTKWTLENFFYENQPTLLEKDGGSWAEVSDFTSAYSTFSSTNFGYPLVQVGTITSENNQTLAYLQIYTPGTGWVENTDYALDWSNAYDVTRSGPDWFITPDDDMGSLYRVTGGTYLNLDFAFDSEGNPTGLQVRYGCVIFNYGAYGPAVYFKSIENLSEIKLNYTGLGIEYYSHFDDTKVIDEYAGMWTGTILYNGNMYKFDGSSNINMESIISTIREENLPTGFDFSVARVSSNYTFTFEQNNVVGNALIGISFLNDSNNYESIIVQLSTFSSFDRNHTEATTPAMLFEIGGFSGSNGSVVTAETKYIQ